MNLYCHIHAPCSRQTQHGLSLIELMISITIGLLILSAMATLFANQSRTRSELDKSNRMIDNGRYSLEVLSENLRLAGFYGTLNPSSVALPGTASALDPCSTAMGDIEDAIPLHVQGFDSASADEDIDSPPTCIPATIKDGSDILVIRRVDTSAAVAQGSLGVGSTTPYLQASQCQYAPDTTTLYKVDNVPANFTLRQKNCTTSSTTPYAELRRMMVQIYYIDADNQTGDGIPTLKRVELSDAGAMVTVPLVEGIEYMQVEYGVDGDSDGDGVVDLAVFDGVADSYVETCATVTCWSNIVSVKLNIIARNIEQTAGQNDAKTYSLGMAGDYAPTGDDRKYKRHAYTQVVRLVNPSSRREAP